MNSLSNNNNNNNNDGYHWLTRASLALCQYLECRAQTDETSRVELRAVKDGNESVGKMKPTPYLPPAHAKNSWSHGVMDHYNEVSCTVMIFRVVLFSDFSVSIFVDGAGRRPLFFNSSVFVCISFFLLVLVSWSFYTLSSCLDCLF